MALQNACAGKLAPPHAQGLAVGVLMGCLSLTLVPILPIKYTNANYNMIQFARRYTHQRADSSSLWIPGIIRMDGGYVTNWGCDN